MEAWCRQMREELKRRDGERCHYTARVERFGNKVRFGHDVPTILLVDVRDDDGALMTDHLWFNYTQGFQDSGVRPGDSVEFCARAESYLKGHYRDVQSVDWKLSYPTKVEWVPSDSPGDCAELELAKA